MKKMTLVDWAIVFFAAVVLFGPSGCSKKAETGVPTSFNIREVCYNGISYFAVWNNNAFDAPYLTGAVIDKDTLQPKRCSTPTNQGN